MCLSGLNFLRLVDLYSVKEKELERVSGCLKTYWIRFLFLSKLELPFSPI